MKATTKSNKDKVLSAGRVNQAILWATGERTVAQLQKAWKMHSSTSVYVTLAKALRQELNYVNASSS